MVTEHQPAEAFPEFPRRRQPAEAQSGTITASEDWRRRLTPRQAITAQERMRDQVERRDRIGRVRRIGGIDVGVRDGWARAAVVVMNTDLEIIESRTAEMRATFPYVPGLLAFRELPVIVKAFRALDLAPDLSIVDGHGYAHPRRFGIACHVGLALDLPTIGCGKSLFVGEHEPPARSRGSWTGLIHRGETIGAALRTREGVQPIYISTGHRVSLPTALRWAIKLAPRYRLPEPIRAADALAGKTDD